MNRTDRLYAIAEELRHAGDAGRTSVSLARQFEVSTRTIKRDVLSLQMSGVPIWAEGGPGGGYRVSTAAATLPPVNFTPAEAAAIAVALHGQPDMPFATEGSSALTKVLAAMSAEAATATKGLLDRVWARTERPRSGGARVLDEAIRLGRVATLDYTAADGASTTRVVEPVRFARTGGHWYLMAYCRLRQDGRWFRLDRITGARLSTEIAPTRDEQAIFGTPPPDARPVPLTGTG